METLSKEEIIRDMGQALDSFYAKAKEIIKTENPLQQLMFTENVFKGSWTTTFQIHSTEKIIKLLGNDKES